MSSLIMIQMWFKNNHLSLYWIENQLSACIRMIREPNKQDTFPEEYIFKEMVKSTVSTRKCGVREVYNWHTLEPRMLGGIN